MIALIAAMMAQPAPTALSLYEAQQMEPSVLAAMLLDGEKHREIKAKDVVADPWGKLSIVRLSEAGRTVGPGQCLRTTHQVKFEHGQAISRTRDHHFALGDDCARPKRWATLQLGASPEIAGRLMRELVAAQGRIRRGQDPGLEITCLDGTGMNRCDEGASSVFASMALDEIGAIEGRSDLPGYRFRAWFGVDLKAGVAWDLHYQPLRDAPDKLALRARYPRIASPKPPPPPPRTEP